MIFPVISRGNRRRVVSGLISFLLISGVARPQSPIRPERDLIRPAPRVTVDGNLKEWDGFPYQVFGANVLTESQESAIVYKAWDAQGVYFAVRTYCRAVRPEGPALSNDALDLFVDVRPRSERVERYEPGVAHLVIRPFAAESARRCEQIDSVGKAVSNPSFGDCLIGATKTEDGWAAECFIPWKIAAPFAPKVGEWLGLSLRVSHFDEAGGNNYAVGAINSTPDNKLEDTPIAFSPVLISPAPRGSEPISYRAEEVIIQGEPWLEIDAIAPVAEAKPGEFSMAVVASQAGVSVNARWVRSPSGRYWIVRERFRLSVPKGSELAVDLATDLYSGWKRTVTVPVRAAAEFHRIDESLPDKIIKNLAPTERDICFLLKACARESATLLATGSDGIRPPRRAIRSVYSPELYENKIELFVAQARSFIQGKKAGPEFPYRAWRSSIDGAMLPVKIVAPWSYDPARKYPARIILYGQGHHRNRAQFMESDLNAIANGQFHPFFGDWFSIVLFDRSSDDEDLEKEALEYFQTTLLRSLPIDEKRVSLYGGSQGASTALNLALHHPERFASIYSRAGKFNWLWALGGNSAKEPEIMRNLRHCPLYLIAGDTDGDVTESNRRLNSALSAMGIPCTYEELGDTRHNFTPWEPPADFLAHRLVVCPSDVEFTAFTPDYGKAYWLTADEFAEWGVPARLHGIRREGEVQVRTTNVSALTIDFRSFPPLSFPLSLKIDDQEFSFRDKLPSSLLKFSRDKADSWISFVGDSDGLRKRKNLSGPAKRIENAALAIVYGTVDPARSWYLRERAFKIVQERIGMRNDQLGVGSFEILSDVDAKTRNLQSMNLWLIGGPEENRVAASLSKALPSLDALSNRSIASASPGRLTSYIYPSPLNPARYIYCESGTTIAAYFAGIMISPERDLCVQDILANGKIAKWTQDFDVTWQLRN